MIARLFAAFVLICVSASLACAQDSLPDIEFDVSVTVVAKNKNIKSSFTSYIERELRSLGDVSVVADDGDEEYYLGFVILSLGPSDEMITGYAVSLVVMRPIQGLAWEFMIKDEWQDGFQELAHGSYLYVFSYLYTDDKDSLRRLADTAVTAFDSQVLKPRRDQWREFQKTYEDQ